MKKIGFLSLYVAAVITMTSCVSTGVNTVENTTDENMEVEFDYKDFSFSDENLENLYKTNQRNLTIKNCPGQQDSLSYFLREEIRSRTEFNKEISQDIINDWNKRTRQYSWDKEQPTFTIKGQLEYIINNHFHPYKIIINDICDLRTVEEMDAIKQPVIERIDKVKELATIRFKEIKEFYDKKGSDIAKGYIYHGFEESERNQKLLLNNAMEDGHAYYITGLSIEGILCNYAYNYESWSKVLNGDISYKKSKDFYINFKSQNLKASIIDLGRTDAIVAAENGGKPIVIGIINEQIGNKIYYFTNECLERWFTFYPPHSVGANNFAGDINLLEQYEKELGISQ